MKTTIEIEDKLRTIKPILTTKFNVNGDAMTTVQVSN